ncbi:MAG: 50S ribosomal protein L16 [Patescibacteria group bacterium]
MLMPKRVKHRKWHKGRGLGRRIATNKTTVAFGEYGLKAITESWVTARQLEAARRAMTRFVKRGGNVWIRIFPDHPVTFHGNENTMGGGKGAVDHYITAVRPGTIIFEMSGVPEDQAREAMRLASHKLPVKTKFVTKA